MGITPSSPSGGLIRARNVRRSFRMGESDVDVLKGVDLQILPGEFITIEGRSGSGKSTLLHILGALDTVDDGSVEFDGQDYTRRRGRSDPLLLRLLTSPLGRRALWVGLLAALAPLVAGAFIDWFLKVAAIACGLWFIWFLAFVLCIVYRMLRRWRPERIASRLRNREFGFVFQFYHLLPELNVLENALLVPMVEHGRLAYRLRRRALRQKATDLLTEFGLGHRLRHRPSQLSGGERQRVAIARALMNDPKVLFADEPTGNLDAETGTQIMAVLENLHRTRGQTIVMVTHDRTLARRADRVLVLKDGRLERVQ